jgi:hypothetical protein
MSGPAPETQTPDDRGAPASAPAAQRYGPLRLERTRKDDGRSLIYYSLAEPAS